LQYQSDSAMDAIRRFETINEYNGFNNHVTLHPLVSVIDLSKASPRSGSRMSFGFYAVFLKDVKCGDLVYGRHTYDYQDGTLVFMAPNQVAGVNSNGELYQPKGHALVFHPELLHGSSLGRRMEEFSFFEYQSNEALHLSDRERQIVLDCLSKIQYELEQSIDKHSKRLIVSNIELFLDYCGRFYDRQFITRDVPHRGVLEKFDRLMNDMFVSGELESNGLPSVAFCASRLNLSPNYFGDLVKKETGISAQAFIHNKLLDAAKRKLSDPSKSIHQVSFELGFKYPQHFTRLFKQKVGLSPNEYRNLN